MNLPTLYHKGKKGELRTWRVWTEGADILTEYGQVGGQLQQSRKTAEAKNVGRANETTPVEQAELEAKALYKHKLDRKYSKTPEAAQEQLSLPMLAHSFKGTKRKKFTYPAHTQPKLDGCVFRTTLIETDKGPRTIEYIVENKIHANVLSWNPKRSILEFRPIVNWFKNGISNYNNWMEIVPEIGKHIKCTRDHKIATLASRGDIVWKRADELTPSKDKILVKCHSDYLNSLIAGTLLGDSSFVVEKRGSGKSYRLIFQHTNKEYFDFKVSLLGLDGASKEVITGYGSDGWRFTSTALTDSNFPIKDWYYTGNHDKCGERKVVSFQKLKSILTQESLSLWIGDDGSISMNNGNNCTPRLTLSTHNHSDDQINEFVKYFKNVWSCSPSIYTDKRVKTGSGKFLTFSHKDTLHILNTLTQNGLHCRGVEYKFYFDTKKYISIQNTEERWLNFKTRYSRRMPPATQYDIEVADNHNYIANNILVHNCRALAQRGPDGEIQLTSRQGKPWNIPHIAEQLEWLKEGVVLDGEIYVHGESCQRITSWAKSADPTGKSFKQESGQLIYHVYDMPVVDGCEILTWEERAGALYGHNDFQATPHIERVRLDDVGSEAELWDLHGLYISQGYEGAILRGRLGQYLWGYRSADLLKVKEFQDSEFLVLDAREGRGKMKGCVVFVCRNDLTDDTFECTMKVTMEERRRMYEERDNYIGKLLTCRFFDRTDAGIPRFPVGIIFRDTIDLPNNVLGDVS